jgi:curli biogenesis system outer membrane secretion channel CsgG
MNLRKQFRKPGFWIGSPALIFLALALAACPTTGRGPPAPAAEEGESAGPPAGEAADREPESPAPSLAEAVYRSYEDLASGIPPLSVAVINVASAKAEEGEFAVEELILLLVNSKKFSVVERRSLDVIRSEQNFQLSGEVDDATAVSIGHLTGAALVITGSISPYGPLKYLRLRALDVETGEIRAVSSRAYE